MDVFVRNVRSFYHGYWGPRPEENPQIDIINGLGRVFFRNLVIEGPPIKAGEPVIYLANHQCALESLVFGGVMQVCTNSHIKAIAKKEHAESRIGQFTRWSAAHPDADYEDCMCYVDQDHPRALAEALRRTIAEDVTEQGRSLLIHVEGARQNRCRTPLSTAAGFLLDMVLSSGASVRPVRFAGGLPVDGPACAYYEFPYRMAAQDVYVGAPLDLAACRGLARPERKRYVLEAIMSCGPDWRLEEPNPANPDLEAEIMQWMNQSATTLFDAMAFCVLRRVPESERSWPTALLMNIVEEGVKPRLSDITRPELVPWVSHYVERYLGSLGMWTPERASEGILVEA